MPNTSWWVVPGSLLLGGALDALIGDPRGWPHPVRAIGSLVHGIERIVGALLRRAGNGPFANRLAGVALAAAVVGVTGAAVWGIVALVDRLGEVASLVGRAVLIYWGLAARSLDREVRLASDADNLETARRELAMIVGRDADALDWPEIHRACVETVGENTNDGIVAALFWCAVSGPVGLWCYKAISTLDSMVGYRNARYRELGWASARLDDLAGLIPARATWLLFAVAAAIVGERGWGALRVGWRDGRKHPSPNSGWGEAALAGALGVQVGGTATYARIPSEKPFLGDPLEPIDGGTVRRALRLMWVVSGIALALACGVHTVAAWIG